MRNPSSINMVFWKSINSPQIKRARESQHLRASYHSFTLHKTQTQVLPCCVHLERRCWLTAVPTPPSTNASKHQQKLKTKKMLQICIARSTSLTSQKKRPTDYITRALIEKAPKPSIHDTNSSSVHIIYVGCVYVYVLKKIALTASGRHLDTGDRWSGLATACPV